MKIFELPKEYREIKTIDLQKNVKLAVLVNVMALVIGVVVFLIGYLIVPFDILFANNENFIESVYTLLIILGLMIVYIFLHELIHGFFFRKFSGSKAKYGYTGLYAYAKSDAFYNKKEFLIIGLSPIVILGCVCLVLNIILGVTFFWYIFAVQIINISGAAGDLYVAYVILKMPEDILINDEGVSMKIFTKST